MRESQLSPLVQAWLTKRGMAVYGEVPHNGGCVDHVGLSEMTVVAVEMKVSLSAQVIRQAYTHVNFAHETWIAVNCEPRAESVARAKNFGMGVLCLKDGKVRMLAIPRKNVPWEASAAKIRERCARLGEGGVGGVANIKGQGPAQNVYKEVQRYFKKRKDATWEDAFRDIPNHYAHARSMQSAMTKVQVRAAMKEKQNARKSGGIDVRFPIRTTLGKETSKRKNRDSEGGVDSRHVRNV